MSKPKDSINEYLVGNVNQLLKKVNLETIQPEDFINLTVTNTEEIFTITVVCKSKLLVLTLDETSKKLTGGGKHLRGYYYGL